MRRKIAWVCLVLGCGGAEFTSPDDAGGQGGASSTTSSTSGPGSSTVATTGSTTVASTGSTTFAVTSTTGGGNGGSGAGGSTGGSGGQVADARSDAPVSCDASAPSPVTFHMTGGGVDYCINNCAGLWISILPTGSDKPLSVTRGCTTTCTQCQPIACDIACVPPQHLKPEGETFTWDGTLWEQSHCGPQMFSCVNQVCSTPPGRYVARMCASRATGGDASNFCMSDPMQTCVDVPFDYPTSATVEGVLR